MKKLAKWFESRPYSLIKGLVYLVYYGNPVYRPELDDLYKKDHPESRKPVRKP